MTAEIRSSKRHPSRLVAIVYVDGPLYRTGESPWLSCYGAFEVAIVDGDPVFVSHHVSTTEGDRRADMFRELGAISHECHVVLGSSEAQETFWDRRHILKAGLVYLDIVGSLEVIEPANLSLMGVPEQGMIEMASTFGLQNCYEVDVLGQARCAAVRAQLVWLVYVAMTFDDRQSQKLFAAFQAWQAIEMARPIPF